ncbi:MAG: hypothetical protein HQK83_05300 [Fibrobacteria bacterium]|nr:hypothetical protein [Fibrobacteria bacterium]
MKNNNYHTPFEKHQKILSGEKSVMKRSVFRGLLFLIIVGVLTYYGKFRPKEIKIVKEHGLLGWVFKQDSILSALIVFPNDNNYKNETENGDRIFINPLPSPSILETSHIRYNKKNIYLLGEVEAHHVKEYCREVDDSSQLFFLGEKEWALLCERAEVIDYHSFRDRMLRVGTDWAVQSWLQADFPGTHFSLKIKIGNQFLSFVSDDDSLSLSDSALIKVYLKKTEDASHCNMAKLCLSPDKALKHGVRDSSREFSIDYQHQAIGFIHEEDGGLLVKKIWLNE